MCDESEDEADVGLRGQQGRARCARYGTGRHWTVVE
jgi:hypothetical protein